MPVNPRLPLEIRQAMVARIVAISDLTDVAEGGRMQTLIGVVADELAILERRAYEMSLAHGFDKNVLGEDLLDRAAQLPLQFPPPRGPQEARGGNLRITRDDAAAELVVAAGSLNLGRQDNLSVNYTNIAAFTFPIGVFTMPEAADPPIALVCKTKGAVGNCPVGAVNVLLTIPSNVVSAATTAAMSGGSSGETDGEIQRRATLWLSSLARAQPSALESFALNYPSSNDQFILYAACHEDPSRPGYSVLVLDDGFGMPGYVRSALARTGTVPTLVSGARYTFTFDFPAVQSPSLRITRAGVTTVYPPTGLWTAIEERGIMWTNPNAAGLDIQPGDTWEISGHQCYTGIVSEMQASIDGAARAAGTRVRVMPSRPINLILSGNVIALPGYDINDVITRLKRAVVAYLTTLYPGAPLYMHRLHDALGELEGLDNVVFDQTDRYPGSPIHKLTTLVGLQTYR